jgi:adenosylhomocysteinase
MDLTFATQALTLAHLARCGRELPPGVHPVPAAIDDRVARHKLATLGVRHDTLSADQHAYLASWTTGT